MASLTLGDDGSRDEPNEEPNNEQKHVYSSAILHPNLYKANPRVISAKGLYMKLDSGQEIFDATGGPAVACIGHGDLRVQNAVMKQMGQLSFCHSLFWANTAAETLASDLISSTDGKMARVTLYGSGSEAVESAMKLARQYHVERSQPSRFRFIARRGAFHGTSIGGLSLTELTNKRIQFEPLLPDNVSFVSACHPYRGLQNGETLDEYCCRLSEELDNEFNRFGENSVCAFVAETVAGSGLGCVPPVPGYFKAMKAVCEKHGALLILDEVMCGMGRTGTIHAWQQEDVVPDISVMAKGLAAGYAPISAMLIHQRVIDGLESGAKFFNHGYTYQAHAIGCAAALEVQKIIRTERLVENVRAMEQVLGGGLKSALGEHPHVGHIRGRGLLWGIEFVKDRVTKAPFPAAERVAMSIRQRGLEAPHRISLQPGTGSFDGILGDHIILAPAYFVTRDDIESILAKTVNVITGFFADMNNRKI